MTDQMDSMNGHEQALVNNLAMLVKRMAHRLSKHKEHVEDAKLAAQAIEFLRVNALLGSMLR